MAGATVSVVIPTHDRRDLLLLALGSVLRQRKINVQVVVVDDGSTDVTYEAVTALPDRRIRIVRNALRRGVAATRNVGAAASDGNWLAFLDDDDLWSPDKLSSQLTAARNDAAQWAYSGAVEIDAVGRLLGGEPPPEPQQLTSGLTRRNLMPAGSSNVLVHAAAFRSVGGFDESLRHLADWDLWLRLRHVGLPSCVHEPLVAYRVHRAQATMDTAGMLDEARILHVRHGADVNSIHRWIAWSHLRHGRRREAIGAYVRAAVGGDVASVGRVAVAAVHPRSPAARRGGATSGDHEWTHRAAAWVAAASTSEHPNVVET